jgi:NADH-quinone oxidoreductase subunit B
MLLDAILKLHDKIENMKLGKHRETEIEELEQARLLRRPLNPLSVAAGGSGVNG